MSGHLPCHDHLFEAKDEVEFAQIAAGQNGTRSLSVYACTNLLLGGSPMEIDDPRVSDLSVFDMFLIISGMIWPSGRSPVEPRLTPSLQHYTA